MTKITHISFATAIIIIASALLIEWLGYKPCSLCLKGRYAWWGIIILCPLIYSVPMYYKKIALIAIIAMLIANSILSIYHAGGEWNWWSLNATCSATNLPTLNNLFQPPQNCTEPALRIFGISLAGYNAILSLALASFIGYKIKHAK